MENEVKRVKMKQIVKAVVETSTPFQDATYTTAVRRQLTIFLGSARRDLNLNPENKIGYSEQEITLGFGLLAEAIKSNPRHVLPKCRVTPTTLESAKNQLSPPQDTQQRKRRN